MGTLACRHFQGMPNRTERNDAVAHSVIRAIELSFDKLLGPAVFDPVCSVVSQFCHRQILPDFQGLDFQGLGCEFVIDLSPMNSNVPGSVDADPHLIAANLSDDNLGDDNLGDDNLDLMIYRSSPTLRTQVLRTQALWTTFTLPSRLMLRLMLANVLRFPQQSGMIADNLSQHFVLRQKLRLDLPVLQKAIQKRKLAFLQWQND